MSHAFTQFAAPMYTGTPLLTPEQVDAQCEAMWDAVCFTTTLDTLGSEREVVERINSYLATHGDDVCQGVLNDYYVERFHTSMPIDLH